MPAPKQLEKHMDAIDASMFTGDVFLDKECRKKLSFYIERWTKELENWKVIEKEIEEDEV